MTTKNTKFKGITLDVSGTYESCAFIKCTLIAPKGDEEVHFVDCLIHGCELVGEGWPQEALDGRDGYYTPEGTFIDGTKA